MYLVRTQHTVPVQVGDFACSDATDLGLRASHPSAQWQRHRCAAAVGDKQFHFGVFMLSPECKSQSHPTPRPTYRAASRCRTASVLSSHFRVRHLIPVRPSGYMDVLRLEEC